MKQTNRRLSPSFRSMFLLITAALAFSACGNRHSSIAQLFATEAKKEVLLAERLDSFNKAVYWGGLHEASAFVTNEARPEFIRTFKSRSRGEKIVDMEIVQIEFSDESSTAEVELETRYFSKFGTNYVQTRRELQTWKYHRMETGWLLHDLQLSDDDVARSEPNIGRGRFSETR